MDAIMTDYLSKLEFGELQEFKNMAVVPLFTSVNGDPKYLTLKEALEKKLLSVKELSHGGSVPELKVTNKADMPILLLDGEEVAGAKQNRVLNTTLLLKEQTDTIIPVSCTEQARWSHVSEEFADSKLVASPMMRAMKVSSVTESLSHSGEFKSDQAAIWDGIEEMSAIAGVESPTSAMSYAMDALLQKNRKSNKPSIDKAKVFLEEAAACEEKRYESIGHGWDYRFQGNAIVGSALLYCKKVIHAAFFRTGESDKAGPMSGYNRRRGFRA